MRHTRVKRPEINACMLIPDELLGLPSGPVTHARRSDKLGEPTPTRRIDPAAVTHVRDARLMIADATPKVLMSGIAFGAQLRWRDTRLWFSEWGRGDVIAVDLDGRGDVMLHVESLPRC